MRFEEIERNRKMNVLRDVEIPPNSLLLEEEEENRLGEKEKEKFQVSKFIE